MVIEHIYRKTERTPEERAEIREIRERFQRERPSLEELVASGDCDPPVPQGAYRELRVLMHRLRTAREELGLSLADIAEHTGIDKAALSRLETGRHINPTIDTLWRYAHAVGRELTWAIITGPTPATPKVNGRSRKSAQAKPRKRRSAAEKI